MTFSYPLHSHHPSSFHHWEGSIRKMLRDQSVQIQLLILSLLHNKYSYIPCASFPLSQPCYVSSWFVTQLELSILFLSAASTFELLLHSQDLISNSKTRSPTTKKKEENSAGKPTHPSRLRSYILRGQVQYV